jgi:molecular chaperone HscB
VHLRLSAVKNYFMHSQNHFQLFNLPSTFNLDLTLLETNFRAIQSVSHPDRFVTASNAEKLQSMQTATLANAAYLTLKNPASRARYLLSLQGIDAIDEKNTVMPADFLMQQMDWRLLTEMQLDAKNLQSNLTDLIDTQKDYKSATDLTRKLIFIDKVCADIHKAIEQLDA